MVRMPENGVVCACAPVCVCVVAQCGGGVVTVSIEGVLFQNQTISSASKPVVGSAVRARAGMVDLVSRVPGMAGSACAQARQRRQVRNVWQHVKCAIRRGSVERCRGSVAVWCANAARIGGGDALALVQSAVQRRKTRMLVPRVMLTPDGMPPVEGGKAGSRQGGMRAARRAVRHAVSFRERVNVRPWKRHGQAMPGVLSMKGPVHWAGDSLAPGSASHGGGGVCGGGGGSAVRGVVAACVEGG